MGRGRGGGWRGHQVRREGSVFLGGGGFDVLWLVGGSLGLEEMGDQVLDMV